MFYLIAFLVYGCNYNVPVTPTVIYNSVEWFRLLYFSHSNIFTRLRQSQKRRIMVLTVYICIYICSCVALKLFIRFWWIRCLSISYYDPGYIGYISTDFNNRRSQLYLVNPDFYRFRSFFTSITRLPLGNGSIVFVQNFRCRVFTWFICFEIPCGQIIGF